MKAPLFITASGLCAMLVSSLNPATSLARSGDITAAAIGAIYNYNSLQGREVPPGDGRGPFSGDNWESCWGADDILFAVHDDGRGFGNGVPGTAPYVPGPIKPDSGDSGLAEFEVYHLRGVKTGSVAGGNFPSGRTEELR